MEREEKPDEKRADWRGPVGADHAPSQPPPVPSPVEIDPDGFGSNDEDGLRMLAALEAMTSLEPDYTPKSEEEFFGEASVTIIEASSPAMLTKPFGVARPAAATNTGALPPDAPAPLNDPYNTAPHNFQGLDADGNGEGAFALLREEADVEIIYPDQSVAPARDAARAQVAKPASLAERFAAMAGSSGGSRFTKALSGK